MNRKLHRRWKTLIRFKVIRASKLLLILSVVVLATVIGLIVFLSDGGTTNRDHAANFVIADTAKTQAVFAVSDDAVSDNLIFDSEYQEDFIDVEILTSSDETNAAKEMPRILIYHTHSHEAYEQDSQDPYTAVEAWRTRDTGHSIIRVGEELASNLRSYGFRVVHDTTDHEKDALSTAYERSLETLESYDEAFDIYIDLHRDAYSEGLQMRYTAPDTTEMAQIMLLIGNGEGFQIKPYYTENHIFAKKLTQRINRLYPGICRDVLVKDGRYNQHIGIFSVLIEIGHNRNTLTEALNAVRPLAEGLNDLMISNPDILIEGILSDRTD